MNYQYSQLFSFYINFEILRVLFFSTSVTLNGGRVSEGHRSPARNPFLPVFHDFLVKNQSQTWLIPRSLWPPGSWVSALPNIELDFGGDFPPFWGTPKHAVSCAEVRQPPDTPAVHWDPTGGNSRVNTEAACPCYGPWAYGSVTAANISFLMVGICYQSCLLLMENQMTRERDQSAL